MIETASALEPSIHTTEHPHIERVAGVCGGEPKIRGTRISVWLIANWHLTGNSMDDIVAMYPHLNAAQVFDALSYYYDHKDEVDRVHCENSEEYFEAATFNIIERER